MTVPDRHHDRPEQRQHLHLGRALQERLRVLAHGSFIGQFDWTGWKTATGCRHADAARHRDGRERERLRARVEQPHGSSSSTSRASTSGCSPAGRHERSRAAWRSTPPTTCSTRSARCKQRMFQFNYAGTMLKEIDSPDRQLRRQDRPQVQLDPVPRRRPRHRQRLRRRHLGLPDLGASTPTLAAAVRVHVDAQPAGRRRLHPADRRRDRPADGTNPERLYVAGSFDQRVQEFNTGSDCRSAASCPAFIRTFGTRVNPAPNATGFDYPKVDAVRRRPALDRRERRQRHPGLQPGRHLGAPLRHRRARPSASSSRACRASTSRTANVFATDVGNCRLQVFDGATCSTRPPASRSRRWAAAAPAPGR